MTSTPLVFTGIGHTKLCPEQLALLSCASLVLGRQGYSLWTGGAPGSDAACELGMRLAVVGPKGADDLRTTPALERQMISWLPWDGFNGRSRALGACYRLPQDSGVYEASGVIACTYHPLGKKLEASKAYPFMRRNGYQVLGPSLSSPSNFVLCSTPDACVDGGHTTRLTGGTGQALRIANAYSRPIFNLENGDHLERILQFLAKHRQEWVSHWELISGFAAAEATKPSCPEQVAMLSALGVSWEAPTTDMGPA